MRITIMVTLVALQFVFLTLAASADDQARQPSFLGGKIWSNTDTMDLIINDSTGSLIAVPDSGMAGENPGSGAIDDDLFKGDLIEYTARRISVKTDILSLKLGAPRNLKFIKEAPVVLAAKSSDPAVIAIKTSEDTDLERPLTFPLTVNRGKADIYIYYKVVCCTTGPEGICFFKEARLKIPVEAGDFEETTLTIKHQIED